MTKITGFLLRNGPLILNIYLRFPDLLCKIVGVRENVQFIHWLHSTVVAKIESRVLPCNYERKTVCKGHCMDINQLDFIVFSCVLHFQDNIDKDLA